MTTYGTLVGDETYDVMYIDSEPVGSLGYPEEENYSIFGPIYTPRVYGLGLTSLEIASSSNVSLTLNDHHALEFRYDNDSNVTRLNSTGSNSISVGTENESVRMFLNAEQCNLEFFSQNNISFGSDGGSINFSSFDSNLSFISGTPGSTTDRAEIDMNSSGAMDIVATDHMNIKGFSNIVIEGSNGVDIRRGDDDNDARLHIRDDNTISSRAQSYTYDAAQSYKFFVDGATDEILKIEQDKVTLRGNFDIHGAINSISHIETQLEVQDKTVRLAFGANGTVIEDGEDNDKAGLIVTGFPSGADPEDPDDQKKYQKSIKWNYGTDGIDGMLTDQGIDGESYWDVRGGSLRLTGVKDNGDDLGFGMRINGNDELEMIRQFKDANGNKKVTRFVRFGRKSTTS